MEESSDQEFTAGLVTIGIPAYNAEDFLEATIHSVLNQTYRELEIIVVDDGSKDATSEIVERFVRLDKRVRLIRIPNSGVGAARNFAIKDAKGKYFAPLDADDIWEPDKIRIQVEAMEKGGKDFGMVYCLSNAIDESGDFMNHCPWWRIEGDVWNALLFRNFIGCASVPLFRTELIRKRGGYLTRKEQGSVQGCEDWDAALRVAAISKVALVPEYLVGYRQRTASMSENYSGMAASYEVLLERARAERPGTPKSYFGWSASNFYVHMLMQAYADGEYQTVLSWLPRILAADPVLWTVPMIYRIATVSIAVVWFGIPWKPRKDKERTELGEGMLSRLGWKKSLWILADSVEKHRWSCVYPEGLPDDSTTH